MKKKIFFITLILCALLGFSVAASTSSALAEQLWEETLQSSFGEKYSAPYAVSGDEYISLSDGSLNLTETDLVLPGKSGLDLEIKRSYTTTKCGYTINYDEEVSTGVYSVVQYYDETNNRYVNVLFSNHEEMLTLAKNSFYAREDYTEYHMANYASGVDAYPFYVIFDSSQTDILLTRVTTAAPSGVSLRVYHGLKMVDISFVSEYELGDSEWALDFPEMNWISIDDIRAIGMIKDINGNIHNLIGVYDPTYISNIPRSFTVNTTEGSKKLNITVNLVNYIPTETCENGISYYIKAYDVQEHLTYYFGSWGRITGIMDDYGNKIIFSEDSAGTWTITDTMGRVITITCSPYSLSYSKPDGTIEQVITGEWFTEHAPDDTENYFVVDDNYVLRLTDAMGNITEYNYTMTQPIYANVCPNTNWSFTSPYPTIFKKSLIKYRIDSIEHSTGAVTNYEYTRKLKKITHSYDDSMTCVDRLTRRYEQVNGLITGEYI